MRINALLKFKTVRINDFNSFIDDSFIKLENTGCATNRQIFILHYVKYILKKGFLLTNLYASKNCFKFKSHVEITIQNTNEQIFSFCTNNFFKFNRTDNFNSAGKHLKCT